VPGGKEFRAFARSKMAFVGFDSAFDHELLRICRSGDHVFRGAASRSIPPAAGL
jgi:hypothetical protein